MASTYEERTRERAARPNASYDDRVRATALAKGSYDTPLGPENDEAFSRWKQKYVPPGDSGVDYDYQGAFLAGVTPNAAGHWPDTFKKPNHPTFSNESQYAKYAPGETGKWDGDTFVTPQDIASGEISRIISGRQKNEPLKGSLPIPRSVGSLFR